MSQYLDEQGLAKVAQKINSITPGTKLYRHKIDMSITGPRGGRTVAVILSLIGNFATPFTGINNKTLVGGSTMKNVVSITPEDGNGTLLLLSAIIDGSLIYPYDENPKLDLYYLDEDDNLWKQPTSISFSSDTVTPL